MTTDLKIVGIDKKYMFIREGVLTAVAHVNPELELVLPLKGGMKIRFDNSEIFLSEGEAAIIPPYRLHEFTSYDGSFGRVYMFPYNLSNEFLKTDGQYKIKLPHETIRYIDYATDMWKKNETVFLSEALFSVFMSEFSAYRPIEKPTSADIENIRRILEYISQRFSDDTFGIQSVADGLNIGKSAINKIINEYTGKSFKDFLNVVRIENAKTMLIKSGKNISETAYECGFGSIRSFNRIFFSQVNCTPKEFKGKAKY